MTVVNTIIDQAAFRIGAHSTVRPLNPNSRAEMFTQLLNMINQWEGVSTILPVTIPTDLTDDLEEPTWSTQAVITNLAVMSAGPLQLTASPQLLRENTQNQTDLLLNANPRPQQGYPDNLPLGKGNNTGPRGRRYWPPVQTIDTESGNPITTEAI